MPYASIAEQDYETNNGNWAPAPVNTSYQNQQAAQRRMAPVDPNSPFAQAHPQLGPAALQAQAARSQFATNHPFLSGMMNGPLQRRNVEFQNNFLAPPPTNQGTGSQQQQNAVAPTNGAMPRFRPFGGALAPPNGPGTGFLGQLFPRLGQMFANAAGGVQGQMGLAPPPLRPATPAAAPAPAGQAAPGGSLITYNYGPDTIRNQPISPTLNASLTTAARNAGITGIIVNSGGQDATGTNRTGSTRHDHGNAADIQLVVNGRVLDFTNPQDQEIYQDFVREARAAGVTGVGAGTDYMGNNTIHVGYGGEAVWGGDSANPPPPPDWLVTAYNGGS